MIDSKSFKDAVSAQDILNAYNEFLAILDAIADHPRDKLLRRDLNDLKAAVSAQNELRSACRSVYEAIGGMDKDVLFDQIDRVVALLGVLEEDASSDRSQDVES